MRDEQLRGWSRDKAELMGMPSYGAHYLRQIGAATPQPYKHDAHAVDDGALCPFCGKPAAEAHHVVQKGIGGGSRIFMLHTLEGIFPLRSPLFGLCHRCHNEFTYKRAEARWEWHEADGEPYAERWADGRLIAGGYDPNGPRLYALGYWLVRIWGRVYKLQRDTVTIVWSGLWDE